jgi:hypothetical protein
MFMVQATGLTFAKVNLNTLGHLHGIPSATLANIRLGWKCLKVTNILLMALLQYCLFLRLQGKSLVARKGI